MPGTATKAAIAPFIGLLVACAEPPVEQVLDGALPSVVLLVNERDDGDTTWGAGMVASEDGLVLTNLHVVDRALSLRAMIYSPDRTSYTPMDGGLDRYLFEQESSLVPASVVRVDASVDLAAVQIHTDEPLVPLKLAGGPPRPGEQVFALGHPQETVWSFTSGVVSAIHSGAIQHDAAVNAGNSGGPLVNRSGEAVGINTSKLFGGAEGVAFALPMDLAMRIIDATAERPPLDLSSPARAATTCLQTQELGSAALVDCYDWDYRWRVFELAVRDVDSWEMFPPKTVAKAVEAAGGRQFWTATLRHQMQCELGPDAGGPPRWPELAQPAPEAALRRVGWDATLILQSRESLHTELKRSKEAMHARQAASTGVAWPAENRAEVRAMLKAGTRVDEVHNLSDERAWVHIVGRNPDGSKYGWSELYALRDGLWRQIDPVLPSEVSTLPEGWPGQWTEYDFIMAHYRAFLVDYVAWTSAEEPERVAARAIPSKRETMPLTASEPRPEVLGGVVERPQSGQ